jgi:hypothetical protein
MKKHLLRRWRPAPHLFAVASFAFLAGCISSTAPILTDGQPLRDGAAREPATETFRFTDGRYVPTSGTRKDIGPFTLHAFEGGDLIAQSIRPGHPAEYAIARKLADGTYLLFVIDEADADEATRAKYCAKDPGRECGVTTREAVFAFARATAAKPHASGGLAIVMGQ